MIIQGYEMVNMVTDAINSYNDQLWAKGDEDKRIPYDAIKFNDEEDSMEIPDEILAKIPMVRLTLRLKNYSKEDLSDMFEKLKGILDVMQPDGFSLSIIEKKELLRDFDITILDHLKDDLSFLMLSGIDLSKMPPSIFARFQNLNALNIEKCNISDPSIVENVSTTTSVSLRRNPIAEENYPKALELIKRSNGKVYFSDKELARISEILNLKKLSLSDFIKYKDIIDFSVFPNISITADKDLDLDSAQAKELIEALNLNPNIKLEITPKMLDKIDPDRSLKLPVDLLINNLTELTQEELESFPTAKSVRILDSKNPNRAEYNTYSVEEYSEVKSKVDKIVSQVVLPPENDPHRQKKIFSQVYKLLGGMLSYDYYAISEEGKKDEKLKYTCRNLLGLKSNKVVCAGFADILKNVLAYFDIDCEFVSAMPDIDKGSRININDPSGHAWNIVALDGERFWADLTWDADYIKAGKYPLPYFLKSTKDFKHDYFAQRLEDLTKDPATRSISDKDQIALLTGRSLEVEPEVEKEKEGYLAAYVVSVASREGISISALKKADMLCTSLQMAPASKELKMQEEGEEHGDN